MATSAYASTPNTTYANRVCRAILGPCSDQLRDVLRHYVPPVKFPHVIKRNRSNIPRLLHHQRGLILPETGQYSGDYSDMDISLLYILLRNACGIEPPINGWGNSADAPDNSLAANIERIREARNRVGHSSSTSISHTDFVDIWSYLKNAVISMDSFLNNGKKYEKAIDFLFTETMDPEQENFYIDQLRKEVENDRMTRERVFLLEEQVSTQQRDIQILQTEQENIHHYLQNEQYESKKQLEDQKGYNQDLRAWQQESQSQLSVIQGNVEILQTQQQEYCRRITEQQGEIKDLATKQQESQMQNKDYQREHNDQYKKLSDTVHSNTAEIVNIKQRVKQMHVIQDGSNEEKPKDENKGTDVSMPDTPRPKVYITNVREGPTINIGYSKKTIIVEKGKTKQSVYYSKDSISPKDEEEESTSSEEPGRPLRPKGKRKRINERRSPTESSSDEVDTADDLNDGPLPPTTQA